MRAQIQAALGPLDELNEGELDGEARIYRLKNAPGTLGFISTISRPFCASCTRTRLTADGWLRLCLLARLEVDLLTPLRAGATDEELARDHHQRHLVEALGPPPGRGRGAAQSFDE